MRASDRFNVVVSGRADGPPMVFVHGFGCDQRMWRLVAPAFEDAFRVVLLDLAGTGRADPAAYDPERHVDLRAYADDLLDVVGELDLHGVVLVGHSVSAMIGVLAAVAEPERFARLVLVGPSPRYIDDGDYQGGWGEADIVELLDSLDSNYLGWSATTAPVIMGNAERPELGEELTESFCRMDPSVARRWARVTFLSDNRSDLAAVTAPTLVLQCRDDVIAPEPVGRYVAAQVPDSTFVLLDATGHCPQLSAPEETVRAIADFVAPGAG